MKKVMCVLIIIILFLMTSIHVVYADDGNVSTKIMDNGFIEEFKPGNGGNDSIANTVLDQIIPIINKILGIVQVIGVILMVISIAFFGFKIIMSNNSELLGPLGLNGGLSRGDKTPGDNAQIRHWMWLVLIGSVLLFMSSTIVRIVFKLLST